MTKIGRVAGRKRFAKLIRRLCSKVLPLSAYENYPWPERYSISGLFACAVGWRPGCFTLLGCCSQYCCRWWSFYLFILGCRQTMWSSPEFTCCGLKTSFRSVFCCKIFPSRPHSWHTLFSLLCKAPATYLAFCDVAYFSEACSVAAQHLPSKRSYSPFSSFNTAFFVFPGLWLCCVWPWKTGHFLS